MSVIGTGSLVLLATIMSAQQPSANTKAEISEPKLPVINYDACPGRNSQIRGWKIEREAALYSSWKRSRVAIGTVKAGEEISVLAGVTVTRKPDRVSVILPIPDLSLKPGDTFLRYDVFGEGDANIWVKGVWHKDINMWRTSEKDGGGCSTNDCDSIVAENGIREWWLQVKTSTGLTAWMQGTKTTGGTFWDSGNFEDLCAG